MRAMATQVEVSAPLAALANLGEWRSGATLPHTFLASLSEAGSHSREPLQEGPPARAAGMPPTVSRPRLTPKPFSRGQSSESFAMVRPPIPSLKSGPGAMKAAALGQTSEGTLEAVGLAGKVPPLVDHQAAQSRSSQEMVANVPFCSSSPANTVILFESGRPEPGRAKGASEEASSQAAKAEATHQRPEGASSIYRQLSLSSEVRPASWNPRRPVERKETFSGVLEEQEKDVAKQPGGEEHHHQPRPWTRPVSVFFLESLKEPRPAGPEVSGGPSEPEKPWARRPRPLSMDLTSRFESRELSLQRKPSLLEGTERKPVAHVARAADTRALRAGQAAGTRTPDPPSKSESPGAVGAAADSLWAKSQAVQKPPPSESSPVGQSLPKAPSQVSAKEQKSLWEQKLKNQLEEPKEGEGLMADPSEKSKEPPRSKGPPAPNRVASGRPDTGAASKTEALGPGNRGWTAGTVHWAAPCPEAEGKPPAGPASSLESSEKGSRVLNIQQRIRELTDENAETKPVPLRRSFRSRPLSADLTKLFSSPAAAGGKAQPERQPESNRKPASEAEDIHEKEALPSCEAGCREGCSDGEPRKPQQASKMSLAGGHPKRDGSPGKERQSGDPQPIDEPTLALSREVKTSSTLPARSVAIKTVRATLFDHTVQRLSVAARHLGPEPPWPLGSELVGGQSGPSLESRVERVREAGESSRTLPSWQADTQAVSEEPKRAKPVGECETPQVSPLDKWNVQCHIGHSVAKHVEESLMYQRIEPRYEILQTIGERVQSEAVVAVPGDKAVTLHSKMSLKEEREAGSGHGTSPTWPQNLDTNDVRKGNGFISKPNPAGEGAAKTRASKELNASHMQAAEWSKNRARQQPQPTRKRSPFPERTKDVVRPEDRGSRLPSETEKGKSEPLLAGMVEGPARLRGLGVWPGGRGGSEGATAGGNQGPFLMSERGDQPPPRRVAQEQRRSGTDPNVTHKEPGPRMSGPRASLAACGPPERHALNSEAGGPLIQPPDSVGEESPRRSLHPASSSPRALDRWRRRTLPHGAASFEETVKPLARRDSLQLQEGALARRSPRARPEGEPKDGSGVRSPRSPSEGKATYFALTCQRPAAEKGNVSRSPREAPQSKQAPSLPNETRRAQLADSPPGAGFQDMMRGSLDGPLCPGREGPTEETPGRGATARLPAQARAGSWVRLEGAEERVPEVEPRPLSHLRPLQPDSRQGQPMHQGHGESKSPAVESYRSRVLDLDLLMAAYQEGSKKAALAPKRGEVSRSQESSQWPWEQRAPPRSPEERGSRRGPPGREHSSGIHRQEGSPVEPSPLQEGETSQGDWSQSSSPAKARETTFIPPHWGRPAAEVPKGLPSGPIGTRKKTFILDDEPAEALRSWQPGTRGANRGPVGVAGESPPPTPPSSPALARGSLQKGTSPKPQAEEACSEERWHWSLRTRRAGASVPQDPSIAHSGAQTHGPAKTGLPSALADLRRSYSEKVQQARGRASLPPGTPGREWQVEEGGGVAQVSPLEGTPVQPMSRRSVGPWDAPISAGSKDQLKQCFGRPPTGAKDTDTLVPEADSQYGTWSDQRLSGDSPCSSFVPESPSSEGNLTPARRRLPSSRPSSSSSSQTDPTSTTDPHDASQGPRSTSLDRSSTDVELSAEDPDPPALAMEASLDFSFLEQTSVLDSSALKTRVQLSKRRRQQRAPLSHSLRRSALHEEEEEEEEDRQPHSVEAVVAESAWMFRDSTGEKLALREELEGEGKPPPSEKSPFSPPPRLPVFPGMDHSALKAQLRKRHEPEGTGGAAPAQPSRAPKSPFQAGLSSGRMLPLGTEKEERAEEPPSPQWLKALRTKKRQSQYEPGVTPTT